jgi:hypothetical protein
MSTYTSVSLKLNIILMYTTFLCVLKYNAMTPRIHEIEDIKFKFYNFKLETL